MLPGGLPRTLNLIISKSGRTQETRNGLAEIALRCRTLDLPLAPHTVAVTAPGSALERQACEHKWLATFPLWDWVGGRTSVTSAAGVLPAALQGIDVDAFLGGARDMDETTRHQEVRSNPAAMMALLWHHATEGHGRKHLVIIPYKDRLSLLARYLQQLVMESLGKEKDLDGRAVHQGLTVYGNKGSTDQHAYIQQLREGLHDFFVTMVSVLRDRVGVSTEVEPGVTSGDYLHGFLLGTREALFENGRESMTLTLPDVGPRTLGALIALFERTVGLYASLINVNAYHQPGVEAGKRAAERVVDLQRRVFEALSVDEPLSVEQLAAAIGEPDDLELLHAVLERLAANPDRGVSRIAGASVFENRYQRASVADAGSTPRKTH
jgi:glucose-6-phosphate isomerase